MNRSTDENTSNRRHQPNPSSSPSRQNNFTWHSDQDKALRKRMISRIFRILKQQNTNPSNEWIQRLPRMARKLEVSMYKSARSKAEYFDASTLKQRIDGLVVNLGLRAQRQQIEQQQQQQQESTQNMQSSHGLLIQDSALQQQQQSIMINHHDATTTSQIDAAASGKIVMTRDLNTKCIDFHREMFFQSVAALAQQDDLHAHAWAIFQSQVVDSNEIGFPNNYLDIIPTPMDLNTIQTKLQHGLYLTMEGYSADVHLTFDNAMTYYASVNNSSSSNITTTTSSSSSSSSISQEEKESLVSSSSSLPSFIWKVAYEMKHKFIQEFETFKREIIETSNNRDDISGTVVVL